MTLRFLKSLRTIVAAIAVMAAAGAFGQRYYQPHFDIGGKAGMTFSRLAFTPGVEQSMASGILMGVKARYTEEKFFGLIAELNIEQRGWREVFEETDFNYTRKLTYITLPILTHIYFGSDKAKGFFNLGPSVGSESISSNFDYNNPASVEGFPIDNRHVNQMSMAVKNKFDYGITAGAGFELTLRGRHHLLIEGRYYYGLGSIFPSNKKDEFSASRCNSIEVSLGYMFRIK